MPRNTSASTISLPPFRGSLRYLLIASTAIYVVLVLLEAFRSNLAQAVYKIAILTPGGIHQGWIWQFFTYGFIDDDPKSFLFTALSIYFLGSAVQERVGARSFLELYLSSLIGAGVLGFALSLTGVIGQGPALGAGAVANAVLMVFYLLHRDAPIMLMFIPIPIPVKYIVIVTAAVEAAYFFKYHFVLYFLVPLLGLATGYLWHRFAWRRVSVFGMLGNRVTDINNSYQRWKRGRAGKKFQVYMRKHNQDPKDYIDDAGNFHPPEDITKKNGGGPGGWVN